MDGENFRALQERVVALIAQMHDGGMPDEPEQAIEDLKSLMILAARFRQGLEDAAYDGNWSDNSRDAKRHGIWVGPGFGGELAEQAIMGWGLTYANLTDYDTYFKQS
jgi:hypothetical protein